jgi:formin-binding protein 1
VRVVEEDDGSGWVKVVDEDGDRGLVPASYVEAADPSQVTSPGPLGTGSGQFGE